MTSTLLSFTTGCRACIRRSYSLARRGRHRLLDTDFNTANPD